jgi:hypothetical protein
MDGIVWINWINLNWTALASGKKLLVRQDDVGHPSRHSGLFTPGSGFPDGQTCDYMLPLDDKSRIHVQCYRTSHGTPMLRVHRDRWDPDRDLGNFVMHTFFETPLGPAFAGLAFAAFLSRA